VGTPGHRSFALGERRAAQGEVVTEPVYAGFTKSAEEPRGHGGVSTTGRPEALVRGALIIIEILCRPTVGFVANFAQEVVKGQVPLLVEGIKQPESRTVRPQ